MSILKLFLELGHLGTDTLLALIQGEADLLVLEGSVFSGNLLLLLGNNGVLANSLVSLFVHGLEVVSIESSSNEAAELLLVAFSILLLEFAHVVGNVATKDVLAEDLSVQGVLLLVETRETLLGVRNVDSTVDGTLHGGEDLGTSGGAGKTNIEESLEGTRTIVFVELSLVKAEVDQDATSAEETSAVSSSKVGQTNLNTKVGQLMSVGRGKNEITLNLGVDDLADDVRGSEADNQAVLGGVVLVLILDDKTLAGIVVSLSLTATTVLDLVALEVGLVLDELNKRLIIRRMDEDGEDHTMSIDR